MTHKEIEYNYIPLGYDSTPTIALKELGLRKFILPFDWVQSNHSIVMHCIDDNFKKFHKNVILIRGKTKYVQRLIDPYGIEYPHDYPDPYDVELDKPEVVANEDAVFEEKVIIETYKKYAPIVQAKYNKKIERFQHIMQDTKPIIILMRELFRDTMLIKDYLENKYQRKNIMMVVATDETHIVGLPPLMAYFNPTGDEKTDLFKWKQCIDNVKHHYENIMKPSEKPGKYHENWYFDR